MSELQDINYTKGVEFGDQSTNGRWRLRLVGGNMVLAVRTAGTFVDLLTVTPTGEVTANLSTFTAQTGQFNNNVKINNASPVSLKIGPSGSEGGVKFDSTEFLQLFTKTNKGFRVLNGEDNSTFLMNIDTVSKVTSLIGTLDISQSSGGQIKFPATHNASSEANTLSDYKRFGTAFVPTLLDSSFSASESQDTSSSYGYWEKIGNLIFFDIYFTITSKGTLTAGDQAVIGNLPFTGFSGTSSLRWPVTITNCDIYTGADVPVIGSLRPTESRIYLAKWKASNGTVPLLISDLATSGSMSISGILRGER